jgi:glutamine amidotransferase
MYFVHSYYPKPAADDVKLSFSRYGDFEFCSSVDKDNIFGCQFHPERSGNHGLSIYERLAARIGVRKEALI